MRLKTAVIIILSLIATVSEAQQKRTFKEKLVAFLDSSNVQNTDPNYIGLPDRPWRIIASNNTSQLNMKMESHLYDEVNGGTGFDFLLQVKPPVGNAVGLWGGYRGWGLGYSVSVTGNKGINMSFNISTPANGVNVRAHRFNYGQPYIAMTNIISKGERRDDVVIEIDNTSLDEPMEIESFVIDGYWIFNQRHFSIAAAYDQSTRQLRSAGSLIAGLMFYYQKFDMSQKHNFILSELFGGTGKMKTYQGSLGLGYTYNFVPARNWTLNFVSMPVLTLLNKVKIYNYELNLPETPTVDPVPIDDLSWELKSSKTNNGRVRVNLATRVAVSYWHKRWFFSLIGQGHHFVTRYENTELKMTDWELKASVGRTL